ncbi:hypothetical protein Hanom_Chr10g00881401 [Helianthus anomalus]
MLFQNKTSQNPSLQNIKSINPHYSHFQVSTPVKPEKPTTTICTVVFIDNTDLHYTVCSLYERTLSDSLTRCNHCPGSGSGSTSKRLFRVLISVATDTNVFVVVLFDRAARVLLMISSVSLTLILSQHSSFIWSVVIFNY